MGWGGGGIGYFTRGNFFTGQREPEEEWFWQIEPFSKLKTTFCEYWASIKMKINLVCVSKEYEIKTKMEPEQWLQLKIRLKNCFYWVITWKVVGQIKFWWMGWEGGGGGGVVSLLLWGNFSRCGGWANFWLVGWGTLPHFPQWEKTYIYIIYIYICIYVYIGKTLYL